MIHQLYRAAKNDTMMGQSIILAYENGIPDNEIVEMIAQQAVDQPSIMAKVIGWKLVNALLNG